MYVFICSIHVFLQYSMPAVNQMDMRTVSVGQSSDERVNQTGIASECKAVGRDHLHWWA